MLIDVDKMSECSAEDGMQRLCPSCEQASAIQADSGLLEAGAYYACSEIDTVSTESSSPGASSCQGEFREAGRTCRE